MCRVSARPAGTSSSSASRLRTQGSTGPAPTHSSRRWTQRRSRRCLIRTSETLRRFRSIGLLLAAMLAMAGCRIDMHVQPKVLPLTKSDFFEDGRGSRSLVPGTIARGQLKDDPYLYTGMINGKPGDMMPFPATKEVLARGRERYNIYCAPCHSPIGDGNGMIVQRGFQIGRAHVR